MKGAARNLSTLFYAPRRFFAARAEEPGGNVEATVFAFLAQMTGCGFEWLWARLGWSLQSDIIPMFGSLARYAAVQVLIFAVILPSEAGIVYLLLNGFSRARASFGATYRVCAYSQAAALFSVLPFAGFVLGIVGGFALLVVGIRAAYGTSTSGALLVTTIGVLRTIAVGVLVLAAGLALLRHR